MATTYNATMPTDKDKVRFLIQDTKLTPALLQDEEINFVLSEYPNYILAAAVCAENISAQLVGTATDKKIGNLSLTYGDKSKKYAELANSLRARASKILLPYAGGISQTDKELVNNDDDRVKPAFSRDMQKQALPSDISDEDAV